MRNFIKTVVPTDGYEEVKKAGDRYVVHLEGVVDTETSIVECYECTTTEEPDMEQLGKELTEWKERLEQSEKKIVAKDRMKEIQELLNETDYIVIKKAEGIDISEYDEKYDGDFLVWRDALRVEYNELEKLI